MVFRARRTSTSAGNRDPLLLLAAAGLAVYLVTGITNVGIFAHDDYVWVMKMVLPAQSRTVADVVQNAWIRNPIPMLVHLGLVKTANALGVHHPLGQMRFDQAVLGGLGFLAVWWAGLVSFGAYGEADRARHRLIYTGLLGFHFAAPFILTRPMFESLSAPFIALGAACACRYQASQRRTPLVLAVVALATGAVLRPQAAIVVLALPVVIARLGRWKDLLVFAGVGAACFLGSGLVDLALRGGFHESFRRYLAYNLEHSHDWGVDPWYRFILLLLGLSIPPVFLALYRGLSWRARYEPLLPTLLVFGLFVAAHSAVPHKEERFIVPVLPLFLLLLTPLAAWILDHGARWRIAVFAVVDGALLVLGVLNPPQRTGMSLAGYLDRNVGLTDVVVLSEDILLPAAFVTHPIAVRQRADGGPSGCGTVVAVLALNAEGARLAGDSTWTRVAHFEPGPLEQLAILLNRRRNTRRGPIDVYAPAACSSRGPSAVPRPERLRQPLRGEA